MEQQYAETARSEATDAESEGARIDPFWEKHDELLGLLLAVDQKLANAGTAIMGFFFLLYILLAATLFFDLAADYGYPLGQYDHWFTYAAGFAILFVVSGSLSMLRESGVYLGQRRRIDEFLSQRGISLHVLLSKIEKSPGLSLDNVAKRLKADG